MKKANSFKDWSVLLCGVTAVTMGLLLNVWFISLILDRPVSKPAQIIIYGFEISMILFGLILIVFRRTIDFKKLLLFVASGVFSALVFVGVDFYLGSAPRDRSITYIDDVHVADDALGWKPKPGSVGRHFLKGIFDVEYEIDEDGFKRIENQEDTEFDVYIFGDSFTFGHGVANKDTFANVIAAEYLKEHVGVYNCGVMGYGLVQQVQRLLLLANRLQDGDVVVFAPLAEDIIRDIDTIAPLTPILNFMISNKSEGALPLEYYPCFKDGRIDPRRIEADDSGFGKFKSLAVNAPITGVLFRGVFSRKKSMERVTKDSLALVELARQQTESRGAQFVLMFLPRAKECLAGEYFYDISAFRYFDLMKYFPSEKNELAQIVFKKDQHWNATGHRLAARAVADTLAKEGIIESRHLNDLAVNLTNTAQVPH